MTNFHHPCKKNSPCLDYKRLMANATNCAGTQAKKMITKKIDNLDLAA